MGRDTLDHPVTQHIRTDYVALRADWTVATALGQLRTQNVGERVVYFYVIDADGKLVGVVPTRRLLMSPLERTVAEIMRPAVVSVPASATLLLACEMFVMHRLLALPVVDDEGRLLGLIDVSLFTEEVFDLTERQSAEDLFQLIGVRLAADRNVSAWQRYVKRIPWLLCNVGGGLLCALLAGQYEAFLGSAIVLALFLPVVLALSESVSMQSMSLTLQALHQERVDWRFIPRALLRELMTAALLGTTLGLIVALAAQLWRGAGTAAIAIGGTITLSVITSCVLGVILPAGVRAVRGDPRIAAGPIVLALADVVTLLLYFNIAGMLLCT